MDRPIVSMSADVLRVEEGSLCPVPHRIEEAGWIQAQWVTTATKRTARVSEIIVEYILQRA
jgi:PadR family transcriptional regulator PadR